MIHTGVRSREGNAIIGVIGIFYVIAAITLLIFHVMQTTDARSLIEIAIDAVLAAAVFLGGWFTVESIQGLRSAKR